MGATPFLVEIYFAGQGVHVDFVEMRMDYFHMRERLEERFKTGLCF